eukprot:COSAG01_NODE_3190_length_6440_cov_60.127425_3_plen_67_part_00
MAKLKKPAGAEQIAEQPREQQQQQQQQQHSAHVPAWQAPTQTLRAGAVHPTGLLTATQVRARRRCS